MNSQISSPLLAQVIESLEIGDELLWEPDRLVAPGAWAGHIPAAFWLVKATRPREIVELGTHSGNSYSAFCQAVSRLNLPTRAYAVDTWQGDDHAGSYGEEVFADYSAFNDQHYPSFSKLMRMSFDDARRYFPSNPTGEIDVLHIDGLHTYEAAKHDFDTWHGALSDRAIVLFHDINVRQSTFGVWRLWQELSAKYPFFAFDHSEGLGVLGVGNDLPPLIDRLFKLPSDSDAAARVRSIFAARGDAFQRRVQIADLARHARNLEGAAGRSDREVAIVKSKLEHQVNTLTEELRGSKMASEQLAQKAEVLEHGRDDAAAEQARLRKELERLRGELANQRKEKEALAERLSSQRREQTREIQRLLSSERTQRDQLVESFQRSTSWRLTAPLRAFSSRLRGLAGSRVLTLGAQAAEQTRPQESPGEAQGADSLVQHDSKSAMRHAFKVRLETFLTSSGTLRFPRQEAPDISIVLILYNSAELTYACLGSIAEVMLASDLKVELVILDNASSDETPALLQKIEGATIIHSEENLHFLRGTNRAVKQARGRFLLFLNNDALLTPGSLEAALNDLQDPSVGAVGGRIVLPSGRLQEAGSIVWKDGTCTGYGRDGALDAPEYMFRRDVDYCSGAFLMTPRALFEQLGAFDERYAPAYYEETDYCLRLWQSNHRVVFDPDVVILHFEFGSSSASSQALALQQRNLGVFRERHANWLFNQPSTADGQLKARAARQSGKRILFIEDRIPHESLGSGYPRARELIWALSNAGAQVTLFPMFHHEEKWHEVRRSIPDSVEFMKDHSAKDLGAFLMERFGYYDGILVCRPHNMDAFLKATGNGDRRTLGDAFVMYDAEALFASRTLAERRLKGIEVSDAEARRLVADEVALTRPARVVISVSEAEKRHFESHGAEKVVVLGHAVAPAPTKRAFHDRSDFLFVGALHEDSSPNAESLRWFAKEVWPRVRERLGDQVRVHVVGYNRAPSILALEESGFHLVGQVEDLTPWYENSRVFIAPTRIAAGIPMKAHVAGAHGLPMVTTDLIAGQLGWAPDKALLASSDPEIFADACVRLYTDQSLWERVRSAALERVSQDCSPDKFASSVKDLLALVPSQSTRPS